MLLYPKHFFSRTRPLRTSDPSKRLGQRIMDDPQLVLNRVPIRRSPRFDREVSIVHVGKPEDLRSVVQVQIRLFGRYAIEMSRFDFGEHVGEDLGIRFESHNAGVEIDRESSLVRVHVRNGREDEREFEEFVKIASDVRVRVEIDGALDPHRVERPDPQLGVLVDECRPDTLSVIRRLYQVDRVQLPTHFLEVTFGDF